MQVVDSGGHRHCDAKEFAKAVHSSLQGPNFGFGLRVPSAGKIAKRGYCPDAANTSVEPRGSSGWGGGEVCHD